jgi:hypothetical protein
MDSISQERLVEALRFALEKHDTQKRKGTEIPSFGTLRGPRSNRRSHLP